MLWVDDLHLVTIDPHTLDRRFREDVKIDIVVWVIIRRLNLTSFNFQIQIGTYGTDTPQRPLELNRVSNRNVAWTVLIHAFYYEAAWICVFVVNNRYGH